MTNDVKFERSEKRLLWALTFFAVIVLVSQVLQFINSRKNENEYRKILLSRMIIVETSQKLMVEITSVHRLLVNLLITSKPGEVEAFRDFISTSFPEMQKEIQSIDENVFTTAQAAKEKEITALLKEYERSCKQFISILQTDNAKAFEYKNAAVRPAFEKYQHAQTDLINILNKDLQSESDKLTSASTTASVIILLLGISPFLLLLMYFLLQSSRILYYEFFS